MVDEYLYHPYLGESNPLRSNSAKRNTESKNEEMEFESEDLCSKLIVASLPFILVCFLCLHVYVFVFAVLLVVGIEVNVVSVLHVLFCV